MFFKISNVSACTENNVRSRTCLKGAVYCARCAPLYILFFVLCTRSRIIISLSLQSWLGLFCLGQPTSARRVAAGSGGTSQGYIANRSSRIHFAFETQAKSLQWTLAQLKLSQLAQSSQSEQAAAAASSSHQFCLAGILFCSNNALS